MDTVDPATAKLHLPALIKEWMTTEDEVRTLSAAIREKRKRSKTVKGMILEIMRGGKVGQLKLSSGGAIIPESKSAKAPITKKYLTESLTEFFKGDADMAKKCAAFIDEHRPMRTRENLTITSVAGGAGAVAPSP
jgi:hypothetical protein